ncbi:ATP-binding cassette domain-containing protein [Paraburkholderia aspalathi]|nr:ATP-binding cassette domain-containing protein [Paraburkholderia aspalathi]
MDLKIENIVKTFGDINALDNVSLTIPHGVLVCFLGPSGCGKTTLLRSIAGLEDISSGTIKLGEADLSRTPARSRNFGVVFQSYSLFPHMNASRNISYGLECRKWNKADTAKRVREMLDLVHLADQAEKLPSQMSGGQQQRIAIARALAPNPSLLLLDEPLSALDAKVREELQLEIRALQKRLGITTVMVTHDQEEALAMADVIVVMRDGKIEQFGTPEELYLNPTTAFVADFIGRMNVLNLDEENGKALSFGSVAIKLDNDTANGTSIRKLGIRPENIRLIAAGSTGDNILSGTTGSVTYLGNITRFEVIPDDRPKQRLIVELHGTNATPVSGDKVNIHLPSSALQVLR